MPISYSLDFSWFFLHNSCSIRCRIYVTSLRKITRLFLFNILLNFGSSLLTKFLSSLLELYTATNVKLFPFNCPMFCTILLLHFLISVSLSDQLHFSFKLLSLMLNMPCPSNSLFIMNYGERLICPVSTQNMIEVDEICPSAL